MAASRPNVWDVWNSLLPNHNGSDDDSDHNNDGSDIEVPQISSDEEEGAGNNENLDAEDDAGDTDDGAGELHWSEWTEDIDIRPFVEPTGLQEILPMQANELDVFKLFFTDEILTIFVEETNAYARHKQAQNGRPDPGWQETNANEMSAYIGIFSLIKYKHSVHFGK